MPEPLCGWPVPPCTRQRSWNSPPLRKLCVFPAPLPRGVGSEVLRQGPGCGFILSWALICGCYSGPLHSASPPRHWLVFPACCALGHCASGDRASPPGLTDTSPEPCSGASRPGFFVRRGLRAAQHPDRGRPAGSAVHSIRGPWARVYPPIQPDYRFLG